MAKQADGIGSLIDKERERLTKAREDAQSRKAEIDTELSEIDKELAALDAYQAVKDGKAPATTTTRKPRAQSTGTRRGGIREKVLDLIKTTTDGLNRADILDKLGMKGEKSAEQSVSNALSALKRTSKVGQKNGKYVSA